MASHRASHRPRRVRLFLEELEPRQLMSGFQPTAQEQLFLEELNDARANPAAYGAAIGLNLAAVAPSQPLAMDPLLVESALLHSQDMNNLGYFAHNSLNGLDPGARISAAGFPWMSWGESIAGGSVYPQPGDALAALIIDAGVPDLGHRIQLLSMTPMFQQQTEVGIGMVQGGTGPLTNYYTIDSAVTSDTRPFITGVVFNDYNGTGKYAIGEGVGNVNITVSGMGSTVSFASGGYNVHVNPGTYTVTASGGGLASPISQVVSVGATNARLNFVVNVASHATNYITSLYETNLGRAPTGSEVSYWTGVLQANGPMYAASPIVRSPEARARLVNNWYQTYLGRAPVGGEGQYWVNALLGGVSEEQVVGSILGSPEYYVRMAGQFSSNADASFIQALYHTFLGRAASGGEVNYWVSTLPTTPRGNIASSFLLSSEYRADQVQSFYFGVLHRTSAPASAELGYWVYSGLDLLSIAVTFEGSPEALLKS